MEQESLERLRHSTAHVMAQAVKELFPEARLAIGPPIQDGFYYDFDVPRPFTPDDLERIEARMREIIAADHPITRTERSREEAIRYFEERGEVYKVELIREIPEETVSFYSQDNFVDLCRGPHVDSTGEIKAFKLLSVAGAYWRGNEKNPMLQRIYGTAWPTQEELDAYLANLAERERRDHRRLGKELDLFSQHEEVGAGLIFWHPKGAMIRHLIESFWKEEHIKRGYQFVYTPHIASEELFRISGHLEKYSESMYAPIDIEGQPYRLKAMNCPGHIMIYKTHLRSYRDLPIRYAELGTVYRFERSGTLTGMLRVRGFTQDDAHIFCTPEQLVGEVIGVLDFVDYVMARFGYTYKAYLATRPEKSIGSDEVWEHATRSLIEAMDARGLNYEVDPGGGVFYGPKIDIKLYDALGREWQGPTVQADFNMPERFDVNYVGPDGAEHRVVMIHRVVLGSMERFVGGLIEHYAGAFPTWLAPVQVILLPIAERHGEYAHQVAAELRAAGLRVQVDDRSEKTGFKIREAQLQKIPYMLVTGDREVEQRSVSVRSRDAGDLGAMSVEGFLRKIQEEVAG
ncbi:MAG TPA: threonine--tRNA ligase [Armatimonadota bacterium]|jgi:threonyl-tRNA synthetase|nr:threonine--tRNA ligase [Armatimonadota bacterium]HPT97313.1 threonine--tRNA ligase [Armatimonadota bacterium]